MASDATKLNKMPQNEWNQLIVTKSELTILWMEDTTSATSHAAAAHNTPARYKIKTDKSLDFVYKNHLIKKWIKVSRFFRGCQLVVTIS